EFLEDHHAVGAGRFDLVLVNPDRTFRRWHESTHCLEQGRFAAARWAKDHITVGLMDGEIDAIRRRHQVARRLVLKRYALRIKQRGRHQRPPLIAGRNCRQTPLIDPPAARSSSSYFARRSLRYDSAAGGHSVKELFDAGPDLSHSGSADGAFRRRTSTRR